MTSKLLNGILAAALGFAVSASSSAADAPAPAKRSAEKTDAEAAAMSECRKLTATDQARCIVNVRPIAAGDKAAMTTAKDGTDAEYAAALKECESANAADKEGCINAVKERFGRM